MLEKPDVPDESLLACLRDHYGLYSTQIAFLPVGNDVNTAVYRIDADDGTSYFVKLRSGSFDETTVVIPRFLRDQGITQILAPITTTAGRLWARMNGFAVIVFPFVAGRNGFEVPLSDRQWGDLGAALRGIHTVVTPPSLSAVIPREQYSPYWRNLVRAFQSRVEETAFTEPVAAALATFLRDRRDEISHIVARADTLGSVLRMQSPAQVLCHADIHGGNVLIGTDGTLYIVDWDTLTFAPKERDLMFVGGGIFGVWNRGHEEAWFYQGYGQTEINLVALAYYRYERIVQDFAAYGEQLLLTDEGGADRAQAFRYFLSQFEPDDVVEVAYRTDQLLGTSDGDSTQRLMKP